jgi:hypothetical protein
MGIIVLCIPLTVVLLLKMILVIIHRIDFIGNKVDNINAHLKTVDSVSTADNSNKSEQLEEFMESINSMDNKIDTKLSQETYNSNVVLMDEKLASINDILFINNKESLRKDETIRVLYEKVVELENKIGENRTINNKKMIEELVYKIQQHYDWYFSIKTWRHKPSTYTEWRHKPSTYTDSVEIDIEKITGVKESLFAKIYLSDPLINIMDKYFDYTNKGLTDIFTHNIKTYTDQRTTIKHVIFSGIPFSGNDFYVSPIIKNNGKFQLQMQNGSFTNHYEYIKKNHPNQLSFFQSIKNLGETQEEFEIRFLEHLLNCCKKGYDNYKLYLFSCKVDDFKKKEKEMNMNEFQFE